MTGFEKFCATYNGKKLLDTYALSQHGIWEIRGEDPNCDMAGPHYTPYIATVEGTFQDAILFAVEQPNFFNWGAGGEIIKREITKLSPNSGKKLPKLVSKY